MVNQVSLPLYLGGITPNNKINLNTGNVSFKSNMPDDSVQFDSVGKYLSEKFISNSINSNPEIKNIIGKENPNLNLNMEDLKLIQQNHVSDIKRIANDIINNLPESLRSQVNKTAIFDAAELHDLGKVLIPPEILNKPGKLTQQEREVMEKHSILSYELLKNTNIDDYTLKLIKYHHQNTLGSGYPSIDDNFAPDINLQILNLADKYSALSEKRTYKDKLSPKQALTIIYHENVKTGQIHPFVFNSLIKSVDYKPVKTEV